MIPNRLPRPHRSGWPLLAAFFLIVIPVLYPLSLGPVSWMGYTDVISVDTCAAILDNVYAPLKWLSDRSQVVNSALDAYCNWWIPD